MTPAHFNGRSITETLSALAHEMAHLWQRYFGKMGISEKLGSSSLLVVVPSILSQ